MSDSFVKGRYFGLLITVKFSLSECNRLRSCWQIKMMKIELFVVINKLLSSCKSFRINKFRMTQLQTNCSNPGTCTCLSLWYILHYQYDLILGMKICNLSSLPGEAENVANSAAGLLRYMLRSRHVLI